MDADSVKVKPTTNPTYNAMALNMEDVKKKKKKGKKLAEKGKKKKKGFFSKVFGSKQWLAAEAKEEKKNLQQELPVKVVTIDPLKRVLV